LLQGKFNHLKAFQLQLTHVLKSFKEWNANSKMLYLVRTYPFLKEALKDSSIVLDNTFDFLEGDDSIESVSVLSYNLSSARMN